MKLRVYDTFYVMDEGILDLFLYFVKQVANHIYK